MKSQYMTCPKCKSGWGYVDKDGKIKCEKCDNETDTVTSTIKGADRKKER